MEQEKKITELENRIKALENPKFLNQDLVRLLVADGFLKLQRELQFQTGAGRIYVDMFFETKTGEYFIPATPSGYSSPFTRSGNTLVSPNHGLPDNSQVYLKSTDTLPSPLGTIIPYYVTNATTDSFRVKVGLSGTAIDLTTDGIGEHYWEYF